MRLIDITERGFEADAEEARDNCRDAMTMFVSLSPLFAAVVLPSFLLYIYEYNNSKKKKNECG